MAKLRITIEIDATDADPSEVLEAAQQFADDFTSEHGGEVDDDSCSVEMLPGRRCHRCDDCGEAFPQGELIDPSGCYARCEDCHEEHMADAAED